MAKTTKTTKTPKIPQRKAVISKNADSVVFKFAPFYNLANVRKAAMSLIVRASNDPAKVEAIGETLKTLAAFLEVRAAHAADVREADVAAAKKADEDRAQAAAEWREADARALLRDSEANVARATEILKDLGAEE